MKTDAQASRQFAGTGSRASRTRPSAPLGIKVVTVLGIVGSLLAAIGGLTLLGYGGAGAVLGLVVVGVAAAQAYVLVELVAMTPWAHPWAVALYGLNVVINLLTLDVVAAVLAGLITAYIRSKADLYRR